MRAESYKWLVLFGCWLLYFVFGLGMTSLAPLVSVIIADLQLNSSQMGTVLGAWQFVYIFVAVPVGLMLQRFGPGRMLAIAALLIAASGFLRAVSDSYLMMFGAVAIFGIGGPIISAGVPQTVSKWFTGRQRGLAMGIYITGPAIAGILVYSLTHALLMPWLEDWRLVLRFWAGCAVIAGFVWSAIWLYGKRLQPANSSPVSMTSGIRMADASRLLSGRNVQLLLLIAIGVFAIEHGLRNWLPEILRAGGWSLTHAGYLSTLPVIIGTAGVLVFPALAIPQRRMRMLQALFLSAALGCLLLQGFAPGLQVAGLVAFGLASGSMMTITLLTVIEQDSVGPERAGLAGGLFFAVAEVGGVSGPVIIGVLNDVTGGFEMALYVLMLVGLALVALSALVSSRPNA